MKNKLLVYQGGGYDGCFWEWNAGYFDCDGEWRAIRASGCKGIPDYKVEEALAMTRQVKAGKEDGVLIPFSAARLFRKFDEEFNPSLVVGVVRHLRDEGISCRAVILCDECKTELDTELVHFVNFSSDGGCSFTPKRKICDDCFLSKVCQDCAERCSYEELYDSEPIFHGRCFAHAVEHLVENGLALAPLEDLPEELQASIKDWQAGQDNQAFNRLDWRFRHNHRTELAEFLAKLGPKGAVSA